MTSVPITRSGSSAAVNWEGHAISPWRRCAPPLTRTQYTMFPHSSFTRGEATPRESSASFHLAWC